MQLLTCHIDVRDELAVLSVHGELDAATTPGLAARLQPLADTGRHLILDLTGLRFCGCAGLTLFLQLHTRAGRRGGSLLLVAPTHPVRRLLDLALPSTPLPVADTLANAMDTVKAEAGRSPRTAVAS